MMKVLMTCSNIGYLCTEIDTLAEVWCERVRDSRSKTLCLDAIVTPIAVAVAREIAVGFTKAVCTPGVVVLSIEDMTTFVHMLTELSAIVALAVVMALEVLVPRSYSHSDDIGVDVLAGTDGHLLLARKYGGGVGHSE